MEFLVVLPVHVSTDMGLEHGDDLGQSLVTHLLQGTEHTGLEEDLAGAELVLGCLQLQGSKDVAGDLLAVDEAFGDGIGGTDGVTEGRDLDTL